MNELMAFFSAYGMSWMQVSLLALGIAGTSGLVIKKVISKKKKNWTESTHSENQNIVPFSVPNETNYDSVITEEVNHFLMPKIEIDDPKDLKNRSEEDFKLDKPSVNYVVNMSPEYYPPVTDFVATDIGKSESELAQKHDQTQVKNNPKEFSFLDSFDDSSKLPEVVPLSYLLTKPSAEKNVSQSLPALIKEDTNPKTVDKILTPHLNLELPSLSSLYAPVVSKVETTIVEPFKPLEFIRDRNNELSETIISPVFAEDVKAVLILSSSVTPSIALLPEPASTIKHSELTNQNYYTGIPTLTDIVQAHNVKKEIPEISTLVLDDSVKNKFVPTVKTEIDEEKFEFTKKYHVLIKDALYFDAQNNKESAMNSLVEAGKIIENIKVSFYLKIAIQSYKNTLISHALPSIINQFYIIEKEKMMKEYAQKKQESDIKTEKQVQAGMEQPAPNIVLSNVPNATNESNVLDSNQRQEKSVAFTEEPVALDTDITEGAPISPWDQGYVLFTSPEGELVALKPEAIKNIEPNLMPLPRPVTTWEKSSDLFVTEENNLVNYEPNIQHTIFVKTPAQAVEHAVEVVTAIVEESNPTLPKVNEPIIENVQIGLIEKTAVQEVVSEVVVSQFEELRKSESINSEDSSLEDTRTPILLEKKFPSQEHIVQIDAPAEETFNSQPVFIEGTETVSFENAFVTNTEIIEEAKDLKAFVEEVLNEPLKEIAEEPVALTVKENEPPVVFAAFEDPVEHNPSEGLLSDPELSTVAENIQQQIEDTDVQKELVSITSQEIIEKPPENAVSVEKFSIENESNDEETKNQFMGTFGDVFKPKKEAELPNIVIPQNRKHTVWVNWMSNESGKMDFKNDMIELSAVWGTKTAIEDLHQQLQALAGSNNQFSVVSVFEAK